MEYTVSKFALKEVLLVADLAITDEDDETQKVLDVLWAFSNSNETDCLRLIKKCELQKNNMAVTSLNTQLVMP